MTTERDPGTRIVLSWLREDMHENAERVLLRALDEVETTQQRRPLWPSRRSFEMPIPIKLAAAAAIAIAVGFAAIQLVAPNDPGGGPSPTPPATQTARPSPTPAGTVPAPNREVTIGEPFEATVHVTLPTDWSVLTQTAGQADVSPTGSAYPYVGFFLATDVYLDPCHPEAGHWPHGALGHIDGEDLVAGLMSLEGFDATEVASGLSRWHIVISNSIDTEAAGCTNGTLLPLFVARGGVDAATNGGTTQEIWVIGATGSHLLIVAEVGPDPSPEDQALIEAIVRSVRWSGLAVTE